MDDSTANNSMKSKFMGDPVCIAGGSCFNAGCKIVQHIYCIYLSLWGDMYNYLLMVV